METGQRETGNTPKIIESTHTLSWAQEYASEGSGMHEDVFFGKASYRMLYIALQHMGDHREASPFLAAHVGQGESFVWPGYEGHTQVATSPLAVRKS